MAAGKSIVITGAWSGIGRATALRLSRRGWRVFAAVRKAAKIRRCGHSAKFRAGLRTIIELESQ
jgi:NAD(P)-dependent dehydrogenase (short-subunit alcohol dehydrogenase family)